MNYQETKWPYSQCTGLWVKRSESKPGGSMYCVLSQYPSPSRNIKRSQPRESSNTPSGFMLCGNLNNLWLDGPIGLSTNFTFIDLLVLPCYILSIMQHHNFFRNLPPGMTSLNAMRFVISYLPDSDLSVG